MVRVNRLPEHYKERRSLLLLLLLLFLFLFASMNSTLKVVFAHSMQRGLAHFILYCTGHHFAVSALLVKHFKQKWVVNPEKSEAVKHLVIYNSSMYLILYYYYTTL